MSLVPPRRELFKPIQLGLVGCGEVSRAKHLPAIMNASGITVVAVADLDAARRASVADRFSINRRVSDIDQLLQIPGLDAIGICTPPATHAEIATRALRAGKHVWIDKPLALSEEDCRTIIAEAKRAGTVAMTGFHMRFHQLVRDARAIIREGRLGRIDAIRVVWHSPRSDVNIPDWKTRRATGGGALVEIAVHHFDLLRFLLESEIAEVFAFSRDAVREDEAAVVSARMSDGVVVSGEFSERCPHEIEIAISGTDGLLRLDCLRFEGLSVRDILEVPGAAGVRLRGARRFLSGLPRGIQVMRRGGDYRISYDMAWRGFAEAIHNGRVSDASLEDGLRATQAVCAALESRARKIPVRVTRPAAEGVADGSATSGVEVVAERSSDDSTTVSSASPVFSVVIPTFDRPRHVRAVLRALAAQRFPLNDVEVVLVNDGGREPLDRIVAEFSDRLHIRLLWQENRGCASARQTGIDAARGGYLAFTDDDCRPDADWLASLHAEILRHPDSALVGQTLNGLTHDLRAETTQLIVGGLVEAGASAEGGVRYGPTCNLAFPAKLLRNVGGLDRTWRLAGGEDRDLCARWLEAGHAMRFVPAARVLHFHGLCTRSFLRQHFNYGRGAARFRRGQEEGRRSKYRDFEAKAFYRELFTRPFRQYPVAVALRIASLVAVAQGATALGLFVDTATRPRVPSPEGRLSAAQQPMERPV